MQIHVATGILRLQCNHNLADLSLMDNAKIECSADDFCGWYPHLGQEGINGDDGQWIRHVGTPFGPEML